MAGNEYHIISGLDVYTDDEPNRSFGQDRHDGSEIESATVSGSTLYTPETTTADDDTASEQDSLISEEPPRYQETTPILQPSLVKKSQDDGFPTREPESQPRDGPTRCWIRRLRTRRCEKKRSKLWRFFIFSKIAIVLGFLSYLLVTICFRAAAPACSYPQYVCSLSDDGANVCRMMARLTGMQVSGEFHDSSTREIVVDQGSRSIWGRYPLYDLLSLKTTSGSIAITIDPQPADPDHPDKPARVVLETQSGSIAVSFSLPRDASTLAQAAEMDLAAMSQDHDVPRASRKSKHCGKDRKNKKHRADGRVSAPLPFRPYEVDIKSDSGSVQGRFIFSTSARVETQSGSISAVFIPVVSAGGMPSDPVLSTWTQAGSQSIALAEPYVVSSDSTAMVPAASAAAAGGYATSSHISSAGSIYVAYPHSWSGEVDAFASTGSICLDGQGLQVTKDGQAHAVGIKHPADDSNSPEWWGSRGDMNVSLEALGSGSINFQVKRRS